MLVILYFLIFFIPHRLFDVPVFVCNFNKLHQKSGTGNGELYIIFIMHKGNCFEKNNINVHNFAFNFASAFMSMSRPKRPTSPRLMKLEPSPSSAAASKRGGSTSGL